MWEPECEGCRYRQLLASGDCHVWGEDCDHYKDEFCGKMNNPAFREWLKNGGANHDGE